MTNTKTVDESPAVADSNVKPIKLMIPAWRDIFSTHEGCSFVLEYPSRMTPDTYEQFKQWLSLIIQKMERRVTDEPHITVSNKVKSDD